MNWGVWATPKLRKGEVAPLVPYSEYVQGEFKNGSQWEKTMDIEVLVG